MSINPPGPKINAPIAILSQFFPKLIPFDPLAFQVYLAKEFGDVAYYSVAGLKVYQLNHPELVHEILVKQAAKFYKPKFIKHAFGAFLGNGLLTNDGDFWKQQRKLIQPAFHHKRIENYAQVMVEHAQKMAASWQDGETREISHDMTHITLGVVVKTLFGGDVTGAAARLGDLMVALLDATNKRLVETIAIPYWVPTRRNLREKRALRELNALLQQLIDERRASGEDTGDLLSMMLLACDEDTGGRMTDQQLKDEMMTLFLAGHETTANTLTWAFYLIAKHPEVEAKLAEELQRELDGRSPTMADLPNLPYTEMVIREALRLYPPASGVTREPTEDVSIGGYTMPKGSLLSVILFALHRDPRFFEEPEAFDPERFAAGWEERIPKYAYLPFGGGPRVCIGNMFAMMEARLVLATLAQRFKLTLEPGQNVVAEQLVTIRPKGGIRMRVAKRVSVSEWEPVPAA